MKPLRPNRAGWPVKGEIVLRKDAKIAIVVILLLMVVVVIIWGQNPRPNTAADPYADQTSITIANNPQPGPADNATDRARAPADHIADLRRDAPTAPPTNTDATPDQPIAMMNNLPPRAELIHEGAPPPPDRTASGGLAIAPTDRHPAVRDASGNLIPLAEKPLPKPDPKPAFLAIHTIVKGEAASGAASTTPTRSPPSPSPSAARSRSPISPSPRPPPSPSVPRAPPCPPPQATPSHASSPPPHPTDPPRPPRPPARTTPSRKATASTPSHARCTATPPSGRSSTSTTKPASPSPPTPPHCGSEPSSSSRTELPNLTG